MQGHLTIDLTRSYIDQRDEALGLVDYRHTRPTVGPAATRIRERVGLSFIRLGLRLVPARSYVPMLRSSRVH